MIVFPNAKINLGLNVLRKRADNFHDIETIFYPVPLYDVLEIVIDPDIQFLKVNETVSVTKINYNSTATLYFLLSGIPAGEGTNLCVTAFQNFQKRFPSNNDFWIHLHKNIPIGAGLGGGSADAAFTLILLNQLMGSPATNEVLCDIAAETGSDCPFFLINSPVYATGRGEIMNRCEMSLKGYNIVIVKPPVNISTKSAFQTIVPLVPELSLLNEIEKPIRSWQKNIKNDFEEYVFKSFPEVLTIKNKLLDSGAEYASMSGSGSAVYGLFKNKVPGKEYFPGCDYFVCEID
jgi:4-diphosphocytidyl-2-C-methyl-D-erythritol kinase